jgi:SAM-dependent methyltransferase
MATTITRSPDQHVARSGAVTYAGTIFLSAFLLFEVQPLIAKMILPWFGGSASVWTVCLLFFQVTLLAGYTYAHLLTRLQSRTQAAIHVALVAVSLAALPMIPNSAWKPTGAGDPAGRILLLLALTVGLPYFVLSSTSPLLQAWWSRGHDVSPYRFYALSNVGSMLALLSYPVAVEPTIRTPTQAITWSIAYAVVAVLCAWIAVSSRTSMPIMFDDVPAVAPRATLRILWMSLAAIASAFLLAITNHISQNVAAVPFLWIIPLSLYLLSFILCFDSPRWYRRSIFLRLLAVTLGGLAYVLSDKFEQTPLLILVPMFCGFLFVCCMFCHGELARLKPHPRYLTGFYLMVSLGGALGAVFVALIAPRVFYSLTELPIAVGACAVIAVIVVARDPREVFQPVAWRVQPVVLVIGAIAAAIVVSLVVTSRESNDYTRIKARNFYGILRVYDKLASLPLPDKIPDPVHLFDPPDQRYRELVNGTINHGLQFLMPSMRRFATTYYSASSGVGVALIEEGKRGPLRVGVIGLGAGTLAAYGRWGDYFRFYDINPLVINIAQHEFTFLHDTMAKTDIVPGDARLSLERESPNHFDLLAVDAFSGDSIPVHLLTRQAFELYFKQLRPDGVLAVHVSNRYLDLVPVVRGAADALHKKAVVMSNAPDDDREVFSSTWVLVSDHDLPYQMELMKAGEVTVSEGQRVLWTDDYSSLWRLVKVGGGDQ